MEIGNVAVEGGGEFKGAEGVVAFHFGEDFAGFDGIAEAFMDAFDYPGKTRADVTDGILVDADFAGKEQVFLDGARLSNGKFDTKFCLIARVNRMRLWILLILISVIVIVVILVIIFVRHCMS